MKGHRHATGIRAAGFPEQPFCSIAGPAAALEAAIDLGAGRAAPARRRTAPGRARREVRDVWYRSPIVWLAAALLAAVIAGCIVTIWVALAQPADTLPEVGESVFRVPVARAFATR